MDNNFDNQVPEENSVPGQKTEYTDPNAGIDAQEFEKKPETEAKQETTMNYAYGSMPATDQKTGQGYEQNSYSQNGGVQNNYSQNNYEQTGYGQAGSDQTGYGQNSYGQNSYTQNGFGQNTYAQNGYNQGTYSQSNYSQNDYTQNYYSQNSYNQGYTNSNTPNYGNGYQSGDFNTNASYNKQVNGMDTTPLSMGEWLLTILAGVIPCAGIILYLVWAFSNSGNVNRRNFCRAYLIVEAIGIVLAIFFIVIVAASSGPGYYY